MIAHALNILQKELNARLGTYDTGNGNADRVILANMAEGVESITLRPPSRLGGFRF